MLVVYKSRDGSSRKYAEIIAQEFDSKILNSDIISSPADIDSASSVILVSRTYIGKIQIQEFLEEYWYVLKGKKVFLVATGLLPEDSKESKESYMQIPEDIRTGLSGYRKIRGKIDRDKLRLPEKIITRIITVEDKLGELDSEGIEDIIKSLKLLNFK